MKRSIPAVPSCEHCGVSNKIRGGLIKRRRALVPAVVLVALTTAAVGLVLVTPPSAASGRTYYVDCIEGDNRADGTTEAAAWQTPWSYRGGGRTLGGSDRLLLKRGCTWGGQETRIVASGTSPQATLLVGTYGSPDAALPTLTNERGTTRCRDDCGPMDWDPTVLLRVIGSYVVVDGLRFVGEPDRIETGCAAQPVGNHVGIWFEGAGESLGVGNEMTNSEAMSLSRGAVVSSSASRTRIHGNRFLDNTMMLNLDPELNNDGGAVGVQIQGNDNEVDHNEFRGHDACSFDYGRDGSAVEIWGAGSQNDIHHNTGFDNESFVELGTPEPLAVPTGNRVAFNTVIGVNGEGEGQAFLVTRGEAGRYGPVQATVALNNSVYLPGRRARGVVCRPGCGSETLSLANNVIWSDGDGREPAYGTVSCDGLCRESHNLIWSSNGSPVISIDGDRDPGTALHQNSRVEDPRWVDLARGDLRLQPTSPAIDAGGPIGQIADYVDDLEGVPLPTGTGIDIGAFETQH